MVQVIKVQTHSSLNLASAPLRFSIVIPAVDMKHYGCNCCYSSAIIVSFGV